MKITILTQILMVLLVTCVARADSANPALDRKIEQFAKAYKAETSPDKKRSMCIEAIDEGLIARNVSIRVIDRMFGTHFEQYFIGNEGQVTDAVYFSPQPRQDGYNQVAAVGWYLAVTWEKGGEIWDYSLSNTHK